MTKPEELLLKHLPAAVLTQSTGGDSCGVLGDLLVSHPTDPYFVDGLVPLARQLHLSHRRVSALGAVGARLPVHASLVPHPLRFERTFDNAVLLFENGRGIARALLTMILRVVRPGGSLYVIAAVRAGARTFQDDAEALGLTETIYAGSAHRLFRVTRAASDPVAPAEWAEPWRMTPLPLFLRGRHYEMFSQPGVFSQSRIDDGTAFLLDHFPMLPISAASPAILDACCGNGVLGLVARAEWGASSLTLADDDVLAIDCAMQAMIAAGLSPGGAHAVDLTRALPRGPGGGGAGVGGAGVGGPGVGDRFDLILCNPPFHQGRAEDRSFVQRFAPLAARALAPSRRQTPSRLVLIANRFLPYERDLAPHFASVTTLAEDKRYRILVATEPVDLAAR